MKNNKKLYFNIIFIILIAFMLSIPYFFSDIQTGNDGLFHISRIYGISEAIKDFQFIPRIYPTFNNNFGYATALFYSDFFIYPFALLYMLGVPIIISFKIMLIFYTTLSVISIFYVSSKIFKNNQITPYITTILYSFSSYHLLDQHIRLALGEIIAIAIIPLIIYSFYLLFVKKRDNWLMLGACFALLLFSHNLSFALYCILFLILIIIYLIINLKNKDKILRLFKTIIKASIFGLLISAWFILPMMEQLSSSSFKVQEYTSSYNLAEKMPTLLSLINPINIFDVSMKSIGPGFLLIFISFIYLFIKKNKYITIIFIISLILILCETGIIPIYLIKQLGVIQFLFRLNIIIFPLLSFISAYIINTISNTNYSKMTLLVCTICSLFSISNIYNDYFNNTINRYSNNISTDELFNQDYYIDLGYNYSQLAAGDYLPYGKDINYLTYERHIREPLDEYNYNEIIFDYEISEYGSKMLFAHNFDKDTLIMFPKIYYKGYQTYLIDDENKIKLDTFNIDSYNLVGADIPKGNHTILLKYNGTIIQKVSTMISFGTLIYIIYKKYNTLTKSKN